MRHGVTVWNSVPALMQMLVDHLGSSQHLPGELRVCMMSGDWIPLSLAERIRERWPELAVYSLGGATEASIWSIFHRIDHVDPSWKSVPYGKPLRNQRFYVLDRSLQLCAVWKRGDLYIGGIGVALGYWRDRERTDASFVMHPRTGERLYRTGDLGVLHPDGSIEFLGREDTQVKIRGHRIELGEIDVALQQHPLVREAVAIAVGDRDNKQLVAYVVTHRSAKVERPVHTHSARRPSLDDLGAVLAPLRQMKVDGAPLPKYRYPSAGSLYPVQTFVSISTGAVDGLGAGDCTTTTLSSTP